MTSSLVQASITIFWAVLALSMMVWASRIKQRKLWMVGVALMGVVVVKLLLVDLVGLSGILRILAFIGVGILMLMLGYIAPLPPETKQIETAANDQTREAA
jgi:uncharacterized membrane protein